MSFKLVLVGDGSKLGSCVVEGVRERVAGVAKPLLAVDELAGDVGGDVVSLRETALRKRSLSAIVVILDNEGEM